MVGVFVVQTWIGSTDGSGSPALAGKGEADSPAAGAMRLLAREHSTRVAAASTYPTFAFI
jgi:hypothetical protein